MTVSMQRRVRVGADTKRRRSDSIILSRRRYEALLDRIEELEDARTMRLALAEVKSGDRIYLPLESVLRMNRGEHPVRVWREFRGLTQAALARKAALPPGYLSEIETGKKPGSVRALKALASALDATVDDLTP